MTRRPFVADWLDAVHSSGGPKDSAVRLVLHVLSLEAPTADGGFSTTPSRLATPTALTVRTVRRSMAVAEHDRWLERTESGYRPRLPDAGVAQLERGG